MVHPISVATFPREDALNKHLAETEQRVKMLEEKLALLESKASERSETAPQTGGGKPKTTRKARAITHVVR